jgi:hypothetical protein
MHKSKLPASVTLDPLLAGRILLKLDPASAAIFADVLRLAFDPDQPRDELGRWSKEGASAPRARAKRHKPTLSQDPSQSDVSEYRHPGNSPFAQVGPTGLPSIVGYPANLNMTGKLSKITDFERASISGQWGVDASTTARFGINVLPPGLQDSCYQPGYVGTFIHAKDSWKDEPTHGVNGPGYRVWASAVKLVAFDYRGPSTGGQWQAVPTDSLEGPKVNSRWFADQKYLYPTNSDFHDFAGISGTNMQATMQRIDQGQGEMRLQQSYAIAILGYRHDSHTWSSQPINSIKWSAEISVTKDSVRVNSDLGRGYLGAGGDEPADWSKLTLPDGRRW